MEETKIIFQEIKEVQDYFNKDYISENLKNQLLKADIIILPIEKFRDYEKPVFPNGTEEIYLFLKNNLPKKYNLEIAINDEDYRELALHHDLINLGIFILKEISLPLILNLFANFAFYKLPLKNTKEKVKVKIIVTDRLKEIDYEGPAEDFKLIVKEMKKTLKK